MKKKSRPAKPTADDTSGAAKKPAADDAKPEKRDVALVLGATEDGSKVAALRQRGDQIEAAVLSRVNVGEAIHGEVVQLSQREEPNLYDVQTLVHAPPAPRPPSGRPAQVANAGYRSGWGRVFGRSKTKRSLN